MCEGYQLRIILFLPWLPSEAFIHFFLDKPLRLLHIHCKGWSLCKRSSAVSDSRSETSITLRTWSWVSSSWGDRLRISDRKFVNHTTEMILWSMILGYNWFSGLTFQDRGDSFFGLYSSWRLLGGWKDSLCTFYWQKGHPKCLNQLLNCNHSWPKSDFTFQKWLFNQPHRMAKNALPSVVVFMNERRGPMKSSFYRKVLKLKSWVGLFWQWTFISPVKKKVKPILLTHTLFVN